jgi:hypothetical protein
MGRIVANCDPLPQSLTVNFSPTAAGSKLILLADWTIVYNNGIPDGSMGSCTDSLGQSWLYANGQSVLILPPTNGTVAGITSITCQTAFPNAPVDFADYSNGKWGVMILHFFEVTGSAPGDAVSSSSASCSVLPATNQVSILTDYTGIVQNYNSNTMLGDLGVQGPNNSGQLTLDYDPPYSASLILDSIYAVAGNNAAASPMRFPNATRCLIVTVPQIPLSETGVNLGICDECEAEAAAMPRRDEMTVGEPINVTNGNTYIQQQDYRLPGLGGGITLERTWNRLWFATPRGTLPRKRMFGDSWSSTYELTKNGSSGWTAKLSIIGGATEGSGGFDL